MCGIFGYIGTEKAAPFLLEGLRSLEYRGYDSAGIFVHGHGVIKAVGPISSLEAKLPKDISGTAGIAHTRWATHGAPSEKNAHPHHDMSGRIWLVHNGIIENYRELKEGLAVQGITFYSDTDTEVLVKLIGSFYKGDLLEATRSALRAVRGTYGLAVVSEHEPNRIIVARMGSPIVLGLGKEGNFIASDPSALLVHTKRVVYLDDGEIASVSKDSYEVTTIQGLKKTKKSEIVEWEHEAVQKNGFAHFMLKEMFEAPEVVLNTLRRRLNVEEGTAKLGGLAMVEVELGSEYRYKKTYPDKKAAALFVSQSGETADTRDSVEKAKSMQMLTLGMVNVVGSAIAREVDAGIYNHAGPEVAVASTKAYISQLTAFALMA